jgi:hypothetical protein
MTHAHPDDRANPTLPITGEVASEGGSYADPTMQAATFGREADTLSNVDQPLGDSHAYALGHESIEGAGSETPDLQRYPTEPPASPDRRLAGVNWRAGALGAAAGAAGAALAMAFRRRRHGS